MSCAPGSPPEQPRLGDRPSAARRRQGHLGAYLNQLHHGDLKSLRLGKKTDALVTESEQLHKQVDRYAYGPPTIRFTPADVDQARAAGVLIEFDSGPAIICDREVYRELCKQAVARTLADVKARVAENAKAKRSAASKRERTPREELDVEHRANLREITRQAHGTNLDLGSALLTQLASVDPESMDVARFFALCRHRHRAYYADLAAMPTRCSHGRVGPRRGRVSRCSQRLVGRHSFSSRLVTSGGRSVCSGREARPCRELAGSRGRWVPGWTGTASICWSRAIRRAASRVR